MRLVQQNKEFYCKGYEDIRNVKIKFQLKNLLLTKPASMMYNNILLPIMAVKRTVAGECVSREIIGW